MGRATKVLVAACAGLMAAGCGPRDDPAKRNPCDAANRTQDVLEKAENAFHITIPTDAADVSFATTEGWQAYSLTLVFRTTPNGLKSFYATSKFPTPAPATPGRQLAAGSPNCELDHGFTYSAIVDRDSTYPDLIRSVAVDDTKADAPRVLVVAAVL